MNCTQTQNLIDEYLNGSLHGAELKAVAQHLLNCAACHRRVESHEALRRALVEMPVEPASAGFAARVMGQAAHAAHGTAGGVSKNAGVIAALRRGMSHWFVAGFGGALTAGFALWTLMALWMPVTPGLPEVTLAVNQTQKVRLAFNAPVALEGVRLIIELPENVSLIDKPGRRTVRYKVRLRKGRNVLVLPVVASTSGESHLVATIIRNDNRKVFRIRVNAISTAKEQESQEHKRGRYPAATMG